MNYKLSLSKGMFQKIHFIKITDFNYVNAGDIFCSPLIWFADFFKQYSCISHCLSSVRYEQIAKNDIVILGGGGILHYNPWYNFNVAINKVLNLCDNVILWGAGFNCNFENGKLVFIDPQIDFDRFKLYGVRDYNCENYNYTPCTSSVNPLLKHAYDTKPINKVASMLHPLMSTKKLPGIEKNFSHFANINAICDFISQNEVIITDSYHCALWATLANRKVVSPSGMKKGSKFNFFECQPSFVTNWLDESELKASIENAKNYPEFLQNSLNNVNTFLSGSGQLFKKSSQFQIKLMNIFISRVYWLNMDGN